MSKLAGHGRGSITMLIEKHSEQQQATFLLEELLGRECHSKWGEARARECSLGIQEQSQSMLIWKGPTRTMESISWPCKDTPRLTPCGQECCQMENHKTKSGSYLCHLTSVTALRQCSSLHWPQRGHHLLHQTGFSQLSKADGKICAAGADNKAAGMRPPPHTPQICRYTPLFLTN